MIYGSSFTYDNISSDTYNVMLCSFNKSGLDDVDMGLDIEILSDTVTSRHDKLEYGMKYSSVLSFNMEISIRGSEYINKNQIRDITRWLSGRNKSSWLVIQNEEYDDVQYYCRVTSIKKKEYGGNVVGFLLTWTCSSPFAYTSEFNYGYDINKENYQLNFFNDSDEYDYLYPKVRIVVGENTDTITIVNTSDSGRKFKITGLVEGEVIDIDNKNGIIKSNIQNKKMLPLFETRKWLRFRDGENKLIINGMCKVDISFRFARKVGDF